MLGLQPLLVQAQQGHPLYLSTIRSTFSAYPTVSTIQCRIEPMADCIGVRDFGFKGFLPT